jgi:ABC-type multidrug transport system fused ATPase/permease subunit
LKNEQSIIDLLKNLWGHIPTRRKKQSFFILLLMVFASFAEILSIGSLLPFLSALTSPEKFFESKAIQPFIKILSISKPSELLLPLTIIFALAAILAGSVRLLLLLAITRLSYAIGADLSVDIYRRTLYQPYLIHCSRNSSEIIDGISAKTGNAIGIIGCCLNIMSASIILLIILISISYLDPLLTLITFAIFGMVYFLTVLLTKQQQFLNSYRIARESINVIQALQEGLGGIRDVLIDGSQSTYCEVYKQADLKMRRAQASNLFIASCPRYGIEAMGMVLIAFLAYSMGHEDNGIVKIIPMLGLLVLGAQRLLPILQQLYAAWTGIRGGQKSLQDIIEMLEQPMPRAINKTKPIAFKKSIQLEKIGFHYPSNKSYILKNINLTIKKGSRIGFVGETGGGKSTLLDIVMGLLPVSQGNLKVDGKIIDSKNSRSWQAHIAHVPQSIFLSDCSVEENIAFGIPKNKIDRNRVLKAAKQAQISKTIEGWPGQYQTVVGERGVRLSGGQRQRIGIARALYKESKVIILDEATSALDIKTESAVMKAIQTFNKEITLLVVAHRLSTLKECSPIIKLARGKIKHFTNYEEAILDL